ncbi:MAG: hypothetical protein SFZ02_10755 [bacterium]|nr:hypothetical protein [bacterium]
MPYTIEILSNMPVIYVKYTGKLEKDDIVTAMLQVLSTAPTLNQPKIFHIMDVTNATIDFNSIMGAFKELGNISEQEAPTVGQHQTLFIGTHQMAKLSANMLALPQFGGIQTPIFKTFGDAVGYIHKDLSQPKASDA